MSELKTSTDIRSKLETTLQKVRKEIDIERDGVKEKERKMNAKIEQLEAVIRVSVVKIFKKRQVFKNFGGFYEERCLVCLGCYFFVIFKIHVLCTMSLLFLFIYGVPLQDKEDELSKQMSIILEMRNEKVMLDACLFLFLIEKT